MSSKFFFSLDSIKPQKTYAAGSQTSVTSDEVPGFVNISFAALKLNKGSVQEPIWHPNANKIGYCLQGNALVSIRSPGAHDTFTVKDGDVFFIPKGYIHHIENTNDKESTIHFVFDHTKPQVMQLSKAIQSLSDSVFASTFNTAAGFFDGLKKTKNSELIKTLPSGKESRQCISSRFKFNIAASSKPINTKGGYLQLATKTNLPVLEGLGILGFGLNPRGGAVEPHWHTNAGELVYIVKGRTRITVLAPDGSLEVLEVNGGQGAFAPASHFHNIENIGDEYVEVVAYFNHAEPDYIGAGEVFGSYSNEVLASIFNVPTSYFETFKKPSGPLVIVPV
jgi:oxalate decarboxylase